MITELSNESFLKVQILSTLICVTDYSKLNRDFHDYSAPRFDSLLVKDVLFDSVIVGCWCVH